METTLEFGAESGVDGVALMGAPALSTLACYVPGSCPGTAFSASECRRSCVKGNCPEQNRYVAGSLAARVTPARSAATTSSRLTMR